MAMEQYLKEEFENFVKKFEEKDSSDDFDLEIPSLELEPIKKINFHSKLGINKLKNVIMPKIFMRPDAFSDSLDIIDNIKCIKIKYRRMLEEGQARYNGGFRFKLTTLSRNPALNCKIGPAPNLEKAECFKDLNLFDIIDSNLLRKKKDKKMGEIKNFILNGPNLEKRAFWIDLKTVKLNPIEPKFVKNISYQRNSKSLLLTNKGAFGTLREVEIRAFNFVTPCQFSAEETEVKDKNDFQRKCVVNINALQNDLLIETLQSIKWQIYERPEIFKGIQMVQVSKSTILFLIRIESLERSIEIIKSTKNAKVIIELDDSK
jgi:hypothetical protein